MKEVKAKYPESQIVISKVAPTKDAMLDRKRKILNSHMMSKFANEKNISFISHENLYRRSDYLRDSVHPTLRGASVFAGNLGRHLHYMFWNKTTCLLYTSPSPRDLSTSRMPSSA